MRQLIDWYHRLTARRTIINNQQERIDRYMKTMAAQKDTIKQLNDDLDTLRTGVAEFLGTIDKVIRDDDSG